MQYNANQNTGTTCFDRLWSSSDPIFELVQVLFKICILRSGVPCAYTSSYETVYLYLKNVKKRKYTHTYILKIEVNTLVDLGYITSQS